MANVKISQLPVATTVASTDILPIVASPTGAAATKQAMVAALAPALSTTIASLPSQPAPAAADLLVIQRDPTGTNQTQQTTVGAVAALVSTTNPSTFTTLSGGSPGINAAITTANSVTTGVAASSLTITTGSGTTGIASAGAFNITGGSSIGAGSTANWTWVASTSPDLANRYGANWYIKAGPGRALRGNGGELHLYGGDAPSGAGGDVRIIGGQSGNSPGGDVYITGGAANGASTYAGSVEIKEGINAQLGLSYPSVSLGSGANDSSTTFPPSLVYSANCLVAGRSFSVQPTYVGDPGAAFTYSLSVLTSYYIFQPVAARSGTFNFPTDAVAIDGQLITIAFYDFACTAATWTPASGQVVKAGPASIPANTSVTFMYSIQSGTGTWYRIV